MSEEDDARDWLIDLNCRPDQMKGIDPPYFHASDEYFRSLNSIYAMTLAENYLSHDIEPYILESIEIEKECSKHDDLKLIWSDDISLTLCFLASLAHQGDYSQNHLLERYFKWWMNSYMCPTGLCFNPQRDTKKSIDIFGETLGAQALGIEINIDEKTSSLHPNGGSLLRLSPIAYFYNKHSQLKRLEILEDYVKRMFSKQTSIDIFIQYIELLVKAINGRTKTDILQSIDRSQFNSNKQTILNEIFFKLISILENDENNIEKGIDLSSQMFLEKPNHQSKYSNPYDSNRTIVLTLYLQISSAIYNRLPQQFQNTIYAQNTLEYLFKWIFYQKSLHLHSIS